MENETYLIKIKDCKNFPFFRNRFIDLLKEVDWVIAVESHKNTELFYIDTDDSIHFKLFLDNMNSEFKKLKLGNVRYSRIHNVFKTRKKGIVNANRIGYQSKS